MTTRYIERDIYDRIVNSNVVQERFADFYTLVQPFYLTDAELHAKFDAEFNRDHSNAGGKMIIIAGYSYFPAEVFRRMNPGEYDRRFALWLNSKNSRLKTVEVD